MTNPNLTRVTEYTEDLMTPLDRPGSGRAGDPGLPDGEPGDEVAEALVAAGRHLIETVGIRRLRMDDVARQAGCGRATLYRRFATRDDLVWAVINGEIRRTLTDIARNIAPIPDLRDRIVEAFAVTLERVRANVLMRRLLQIEPDLLLPHLTTRGAAALAISRELMVTLLEEGRSRGELRRIETEITAELLVRVAHSMLLTPQGPIAIGDPVALRSFARTFIADPLFRPAA
ncbi:MAG TPA: TetR/AcrR family transcriptional regulator [Euzebya sp.]|nr:TetR/AcrR family transcriptional regulator [Euzebya sp.]